MNKNNSKFRIQNLKLVFLLLSFIASTAMAEIKDSIGVEKKDGKVFVLHQVDAKETLYSISRRYAAKVEDIKAANPDMGEAIKIGQTLRIPYKGTAQNIGSTTSVATDKNGKTHTIEKKETLYSISKEYGVTVEELTKANPGIENGLKEGQTIRIPVSGKVAVPEKEAPKNGKIHQVEAKETLFGISRKYNVSVDDIKKANPQLIDGLKEGMEIVIPEKGSKPAVSSTTTNNNTTATRTNTSSSSTSVSATPKEKEREKEEDNEPVTPVQIQTPPKGEFKKITENGIAELLESKTDAPKFQALHKTAPVGTIIQVVNESNGQKIFVRVIGKLVDVSDSKTIVKISQKAMDRLEVKDKKVAVTLTYIP